MTLTDFTTLGLSPALVSALSRTGMTAPTPIQTQAIPLALAGHDILGLAQTGTGKTLAFGLPLVARLFAADTRPAPRTARSLILAPTRELANQITEALRPLIQRTRLRITTVVGGQSLNRQVGVMAMGIDILVATPGRLIDLMDRGAVDLAATRFLVLDEADQMLDLGFIHALRRIAAKLGSPRQTMLFSATMAKQMEEIAQSYLTDPKRVQVAPPGTPVERIAQSVHFLEKARKPAVLREILDRHAGGLTLVFGRTKHGSEKICRQLVADGYGAVSVHGNKSQGQRDRAIAAVRAGTARVLVATDVAARGIDIPGVSAVVNYDLPDVPETYVHRIGRTARAGQDGEAVALCCPEEMDQLRDIEKLLKTEIPVASGTRPMPGRSSSNAGRAPSKPAQGSRRGGKAAAAGADGKGQGHGHGKGPGTAPGKSREQAHGQPGGKPLHRAAGKPPRRRPRAA